MAGPSHLSFNRQHEATDGVVSVCDPGFRFPFCVEEVW